MNYAENILCGKDDAVAIIEINEEIQKSPRNYTWKELRELVARYAGVLKREGATEGDVIVRKCHFPLLGCSSLIISQSSEAITPDLSLSYLLQLRSVLCLHPLLQILVRRYVHVYAVTFHYLTSCLTVAH
jgi:acyl-CoA synthetase (AMP-forming)/AMP-acid ligase II